MALQHLRSSTANKRPTPAAMSDGQLAMNTNLASPGLFFKDSNGDSVKIGPVHVGTTAPNVTPGAGGQAGNSVGEAWLDTTAANPILKVWNGSAFVAVQPVGTGTVVSTTDTGTVTSTMILDGTILNADINASAAIADTKLATIATAGKVSNSATTAASANTLSAIVARDPSGNFTAGTITAALTGAASSNVLKAGDTMTGALAVPLASAATPSLTFTGDTNTGIFSPGADQVAISTNGTGRLYIASDGKVGVDTTGPGAKLDVVGESGTSIIRAVGADTHGNADAEIFSTGSAGNSRLYFSDTAAQSGSIIYTHSTNSFAFATAGSERLRITSAGLVGIGTSAPDSLLHLSSVSAAMQILSRPGVTDGNGSDVAAIAFANGVGSVSEIRVGGDGDMQFNTRQLSTNSYATRLFIKGSTGTITFGAYGAGTLSTSASGVISASDGRYKTKTRQLESGLEAIAALEPTYYRWNEGSPFESEYEELGFVAQEVAAVIPEASPGEDEEGKYRNYHDRAIIAMLVKGMQEQQSIITALTARVAALEAN